MASGKWRLPNEEGEYRCSSCRKYLPLWDFHKDATKSRGIKSICKTCHSSISKEKKLYSKYGLTVKQFEQKLDDQNGQCACCEDDLIIEGRENRRPNVDHNHSTGEIRDILCTRCNFAIGYLKDSSIRAFKALKYLIKWGC